MYSEIENAKVQESKNANSVSKYGVIRNCSTVVVISAKPFS